MIRYRFFILMIGNTVCASAFPYLINENIALATHNHGLYTAVTGGNAHPFTGIIKTDTGISLDVRVFLSQAGGHYWRKKHAEILDFPFRRWEGNRYIGQGTRL